MRQKKSEPVPENSAVWALTFYILVATIIDDLCCKSSIKNLEEWIIHIRKGGIIYA